MYFISVNKITNWYIHVAFFPNYSKLRRMKNDIKNYIYLLISLHKICYSFVKAKMKDLLTMFAWKLSIHSSSVAL